MLNIRFLSLRPLRRISSSFPLNNTSVRTILSFKEILGGANKDVGIDEFFEKVKSINEDTLKPINSRLMGPLEKSIDEIPPLPQVLILGNHSSGKSTFINYICGRKIQTTGVAPTDDGFTIIAPGNEDIDQDGPSLVGDPNMGMTGLRSFGTGFVNHLNLKIRSNMLIRDLMIIDSPGMIDSPMHLSYQQNSNGAQNSPSAIHDNSGKDRGYDFRGVVKWLAERADVILLFQDPAKPGTTGETLSIMTTALAGQDHKTFIVMNKADHFQTRHDYARAYGALCWNISKVIPRKDLPRIYTMCVPTDHIPTEHTFSYLNSKSSSSDNSLMSGVDSPSSHHSSKRVSESNPVDSSSELWDLHQTREEIMTEVFRAPLRRVDNLLTRSSDSARMLLMHAELLKLLKRDLTSTALSTYGTVLLGSMAGAASSVFLLTSGVFSLGISLGALTALGTGGGMWVSRRKLNDAVDSYVRGVGFDALFQRRFYLPLAEQDATLQQTYDRVVPQLRKVAASYPFWNLPSPRSSDINALDNLINERIPSLRRSASYASHLSDGLIRAAESGGAVRGWKSERTE